MIALPVVACDNKVSLEEQAQTLYRESMELHDAVMPRMDEMFTFGRNPRVHWICLKQIRLQTIYESRKSEQPLHV